MNAVLIGNYGVGNFGDEALKEYFVNTFTEVQWTVLSATPERGELPRLPIGVRSFFGTPWLKTLWAIQRTDAIVFGGGTLFTDIESVKACVLWGAHAFVARCLGSPYHLAFQGVGPFHTRLGQGIARWVFRHARSVSVRDVASAERVRSWLLAAPILETFDPVFLTFLRAKHSHVPDGTVVLIPRDNSDQKFLEAANTASGARIVIATFKPDDVWERSIVTSLRAMHPTATVQRIVTVDDLMRLLAQASRCVTERFHGALAAAAAGVPLTIISQAEGDKLDQARALEAPGAVDTARALVQKGEDTLREALRD